MAEEIAITQEIIEEEEIEQDQYLVFMVQDQEFSIQAMRVQEISQLLPVISVPNAPTYIEGILNLRGRLVSVVNFRKKFGFEHKNYDEDTRIVMVEYSGFPIGLIVDSVAEVIRISNDKVQKLPETSTTAVTEGYIRGVGMLDKRLVILLDADKLFDKTEMAEVHAVKQAIEAVKAVDIEEQNEGR